MKAIFKDYLRAITKSINRFISIVLIIAVGAGFYAGLKSTGPDMRLTADKYYIDSGLMDLRIFGNYDIDDGDIELVRQMDGILEVSGEYSLDAFNKTTGDNLHIMSVPDLESGLNKPTLKSGRMPENPDECVVDDTALGKTYRLGDMVELYLKDGDITSDLDKTKFEVVGTVTSPMYVSNSRGVSSIGTGYSDGFILLPKEAFSYKYYTEAFVKLTYDEELSSFSNDYDHFVNQRKIAIEEVLRDGKEDRYNRLTAVFEEDILRAEKDGDNAKAEIKRCENDLKLANDALSNARGMVELSENELDNMQSSIDTKNSEIDKKRLEIDGITADAKKVQDEIDAQELVLAAEREVIDADEDQYNKTEKYNAALEKTEGYLLTMRLERERIDREIAKWDVKRNDLDDIIAKLALTVSVIPQIESEINALDGQVQEEQLALDAAIEVHENKAVIISDNEKIVDESELALESARAKLDQSLEDIKKSEDLIDAVGHIYYFVTDRTFFANYEEYGANSERIDAIANVFPIFFIVIAALVCLTTMTRMVEEQITLIGTYKALGYGNFAIVGKYLTYAFLASIIGNIIGLNVGFRLFPSIIMGAYGLLYNMPAPSTPFRWDYSLATTIASLGCTMITAFAACRGELRAVPAGLMRPKSPKGGKRILLERIKPLWRTLGFNAKITLRNLFRYKRRMIMTVFGIAGCTALMLAGLGFRNSLFDIVNLQFGDIFEYDMMITIDDSATDGERDELNKLFKDQSAFDYYTYQKTIDVMSREDRVTSTLIVANAENDISQFIKLRHREDKSPIEFGDDTVIISEKLADLMGVSEGDTFAMMDTDNTQYQAIVSGITENYAGHYMYMGDLIYSQYFAEIPEYTDILVKLENPNADSINDLAEQINKLDFVREAQLTSLVKNRYEDQISSMNILVYVLIGSAAILAFVVMYNLTSINVAERMRELSTIKVLGFYDREVTGYIGRENIILTILGIAAGLFAGIYLFLFIVSTAEVETMMFGRTIQNASFVISAGLTFAFTLIVNIAMHFSLKKIDMIGALKSVE